MLEDGRHTPSAGWATSVATGWAWRSRETIFRWEDQENIRIFCGQIHQRKLQSHDFSGADGHDEGSSKHPMDSAVDYAAESSAFRELCFEVGRVQLQAIFISASTCDASLLGDQTWSTRNLFNGFGLLGERWISCRRNVTQMLKG